MAIASESSNAYKCLLLFVLFITYTYTIFSRYLIIFLYSVPVPDDATDKYAKWLSIKEAFDISASQYGYLTGPAFMGIFMVFNMFSGWFGDNLNRKYVMLTGLVISVGSIIAIKWVDSYWHLLGLRCLLALGQSNFAPIAYSIINAYFVTKKTLATSLMTSGVYVGYGASTTVLLVLPHWGWASTSLYIGFLGVAACVLFLFFVIEPERENQTSPAAEQRQSLLNSEQQQQSDQYDTTLDYQTVGNGDDNNTSINTNGNNNNGQQQQQALKATAGMSWFKTTKYVLTSSHIWLIIAILTFRLSAGGVLGSFFPLLIKRRFPNQKNEFATINALVVSIAGILSGLMGGMICDRWVASDNAKRAELREAEQSNLLTNGEKSNNNVADNGPSLKPYLWLTALSCLCCLPLFTLVFLAKNLYLAMAALFVAYLVSECYFAPCLSLMHASTQTPKGVKSSAVSVSIGIAQLISAVSPVIVGMIDDKYFDAQTELLIGFLAQTGISGIIALVSICFVKN